MKMNCLLLYSLISFSIFLWSINSFKIRKSKSHMQKANQDIRPNVNDITKLVRPVMVTPYKPKIVDSLNQLDNTEEDIFKPVEIVGNPVAVEGTPEKPTMYSTVINPTATSIKHEKELNNYQLPNVQTTPAIAKMMSGNEMQRLIPGQMAIPVKISGVSIGDPTLSNYETPLFLSKKQSLIKDSVLKVPKTSMISPDLAATSVADLKKITSKLRLAKSNWEKKKALKDSKTRLEAEVKQITGRIAQEVKQLLHAKCNANSLNKLLNKFAVKIQRDQIAKLNLVDRVQIKNDLKAKLEKDVQGLRTPGTQYDSVKKVDPKDLSKIVMQIKKKLGI